MSYKRLTPCIFIRGGKAVKWFDDRDVLADDVIGLAKQYSERGADELIVFDLSDSDEEHDEAIDRIESVINKAGGSSSLCKVADGSGVSLYNYTTACVETALLRYAYRNSDRIYKYLYPSLPVSGMDGTLSNRMKHGNSKGSISAKTGTLEGVSSLSGYCNASNGHLMAFTVICNGVLRGSVGRSVQDKICHILTH